MTASGGGVSAENSIPCDGEGKGREGDDLEWEILVWIPLPTVVLTHAERVTVILRRR